MEMLSFSNLFCLDLVSDVLMACISPGTTSIVYNPFLKLAPDGV